MNDRRLAFVITGLGRGGAETQLTRLVLHLAARGYELRVVSLLPLDGFASVLLEAGIPVDTLNLDGMGSLPTAAFRLTSLLRSHEPFAVVSFMYHANILCRITRGAINTRRLISSIRNEQFGGWHREFLTHATDRLSDLTVANSRVAALKLVERGVVSRDRIRVIPNALPERSIRAEPACSPASVYKCNAFVWINAGRLEQQKDHATLLSAFALVRKRQPNSQLLIAGDGPLRSILESQARRLELANSVQFLGFRNDLPDLVAAADGFVLSSAWEGLPNVVMEALLAGKPVVGTDVGGMRELVCEATGYLIPPRNPHLLADRMLRVMSWSEQRRQDARRAAAAQVAQFSIDRIAAMWERAFFSFSSHSDDSCLCA